MLHRKMTASLQNIVEADQVGLDISVRMIDTVAHACLCGQVHDHGKAMLLEQAVDQRLVGDVALDKLEVAIRRLVNLLQPPFLDAHIVVGHERITAYNLYVRIIIEQADRQCLPDKSSRTSDENCFTIEVYVVFSHSLHSISRVSRNRHILAAIGNPSKTITFFIY